MSTKTRKITMLAMLAAIAYAVMYISHLLPPIVSFLRYDPKDVIIIFGGFAYGPSAVVIISVVVSFIEMISISGTGWWGLLMNIISTLAFALPIVAIYRKKHTKSGAYLALATGTVTATAVMMLWNIIVTPIYMGMERQAIIAMLPTVFLPFNLIKTVLNSALLLVLYKPLMSVMRRFCSRRDVYPGNPKPSVVTFIVSALLVGGCIAAVILLKK